MITAGGRTIARWLLFGIDFPVQPPGSEIPPHSVAMILLSKIHTQSSKLLLLAASPLLAPAIFAGGMEVYENIDLNDASSMPARLVPLPAQQTSIQEGFLDVTKAPYFADNTGATDAQPAIQMAIDDAYAANLIVFFPSGTYLCKSGFKLFQSNGPSSASQRKFAHKLVGSTDSARPVLKLADGSTLADSLFLHFAWYGVLSGTSKFDGSRHYCATLRGINIDMGNNPTGSAVSMEGAQYCAIEDVHIYGTSFDTGVASTPGGGGSTTNLKVTGGRIGVKADRVVPSIAGLELVNQSLRGLDVSGSAGPLVVTGFSITSQPSPASDYRAVYLRNTATGENAGHGNLVMVDGSIEVFGSGGKAIYNYNQDVYLQDVYIKAATLIQSGFKNSPTESVSGSSSSWRHLRRYAFRCGDDNADMVLDGTSLGSPNSDHQDYKALLTVSSPPGDLISRHTWGDDFPSWEDSNLVSITEFGAVPENTPGADLDNTPAIQAALDATTTIGHPDYGKTVFVPRGIFNVASPIFVPAGARLIGAGENISVLDVSTTWQLGSPASVLSTADSATAEIVLAHFAIVGNVPTAGYSSYPALQSQRFLRLVTIQSGLTLWRDVQLDLRVVTWNNRQQTEPMVLMTGNAGGRFYNLVNDNTGPQDWAPGHPGQGYNKLRINGTSNPLVFYQPDFEHLVQSTGQVNIADASDVRFYGMKWESMIGGAPGLRFLDATNVARLHFLGSYGNYNNTDPDGVIILNGQSEDVRIANMSHKLFDDTTYGQLWLSDIANGITLADGPTLVLYSRNFPDRLRVKAMSLTGEVFTITFAAGPEDAAVDFTLQSSGSLDSFSDDPSAGPVTGGDGVFQVAAPLTYPARFYRLQRD
jgi:hypothetical protein